MFMIILIRMTDPSVQEFVGMVKELDLRFVMMGTKMTTLAVNLIALEVCQAIHVLEETLFLPQLAKKYVVTWS